MRTATGARHLGDCYIPCPASRLWPIANRYQRLTRNRPRKNLSRQAFVASVMMCVSLRRTNVPTNASDRCRTAVDVRKPDLQLLAWVVPAAISVAGGLNCSANSVDPSRVHSVTADGRRSSPRRDPPIQHPMRSGVARDEDSRAARH